MSKIDWSKTPDAQFFVNGSFYKYDQGKWFWSSSDGIWAKTPYESPENFSWWGFRVEAPVAWNGEGLPPVGLPVEWYSDSNTGWQEIVVLAYHGDDAWIQPKGKESMIVGNIANFRPIRTPEQISAEKEAERKQESVAAALRAIGGSSSKITSASNVSDVISALYDAGLIKSE